LKKVKSQLGISPPWKPSFSLSKRKNKYHKGSYYLIKFSKRRLRKKIKLYWEECSTFKVNQWSTHISISLLQFHQIKSHMQTLRKGRENLQTIRSIVEIEYMLNNTENFVKDLRSNIKLWKTSFVIKLETSRKVSIKYH